MEASFSSDPGRVLQAPFSLHDGFLASAARDPAAPALRIGDAIFSYAALERAARSYHRTLADMGVQRGDRVGLMLSKSFALYAAVLGTLMAGAAYVPLAPTYPAERLRLIVDQAEPTVIVYSDPSDIARLNADSPGQGWPSLLAAPVEADANPRPQAPTATAEVLPTDLAYILFTSGSTGIPKGVMVSHANATAFVNWAVAHFGLRPGDQMSGHSDLNFDLSVFDTFAAWAAGACLVPVIDPADRATPGNFIRENGISVWFSVPSVLSGMAVASDLDPAKLAGLRWILFCGEPLLPGPVRLLMRAAPQARVANLYGPTEATVAASAFILPGIPEAGATAIPIGWRTAKTEIFVWTDDGRVAETGETGEILISGDQVALGYWRNPDETDRRFVSDPRFPADARRCYRTGDRAEVQPPGPLFRGRNDNQVKFRGWRVELGDIEQALARQPEIAECAVSLLRREGKPDALAAFLRCSAPIKPNEILARLREILPGYMLPTHIRIVDQLPRTLNDKIDRARLAELF